MLMALQDEGVGCLVTYKDEMERGTVIPNQYPSQLDGILEEFNEVFLEPKGLPPQSNN